MNRYVVLAILAAMVATGVSISGCNRNRDNRLASNTRRAQGTSARRTGEDRPVRPAEVLSASARRNNRPRRSPAATYDRIRANQAITASAPAVPAPAPIEYYSPSPAPVPVPAPRYEYAYVNEPLPEPVPVMSPVYTLPTTTADGGTFHSQPYYLEPVYSPAAPAPVYQPAVYAMAEPAYVAPAHQTPELAWARAALEPMAMAPAMPLRSAAKPVAYPGGFVNPEPITPVCYPTPQGTEVCYPVPIPELEPVRYRRVATNWSGPGQTTSATQVPTVPILPAISSVQPAQPVQPLQPARQPQFQPLLQPIRETASQTTARPVVQPANFTRPSTSHEWNSRQEAMQPLQGWVPSPTTASRNR
ncbi:MAG: hypothetical protein LIQ31_14865 [Planctomycetes bacterium]|nr:hypothetical protein [Planctomycetota bacterium]